MFLGFVKLGSLIKHQTLMLLFLGYELVRTDTYGHIPKHGVCFYVKKGIHYESVPSNCPNLHTIYLISYNIYAVLVYRPPSNNDEDNTCLLQYLLNFCIVKEVLII